MSLALIFNCSLAYIANADTMFLKGRHHVRVKGLGGSSSTGLPFPEGEAEAREMQRATFSTQLPPTELG